jgi:hypothetical protein
MGHASNFGLAFAKAEMGANQRIPIAGGALLTVNNNDKNAIKGPPCFQPRMVIVCVVEGPGKMLQNAFTSVSVSREKNRCLSTSRFLNCGICI